ncbi:MAG TPA: NAD(P)-dependent oxidoreductase [Nocardioidaceae bacterium]|nr:NAD(P)-dependent oxidoreductase [Nocardioidaceae bacterium]
MRVLLTGAAGSIGSVLADGLRPDHELRALDLREPETAFAGGVVVGDCADPDVAARAVDGMDAVVHLAGVATESDLPTILHGHVETTAALLDAMVQSDVRRMVYASSNHAVGMHPRTQCLGVDVAMRPDTFYGVGKVAAEALLSLYADRYGISSVAMRIGSFLEAPQSRRNLATWLSHGDCIRMVSAALTAELDGYYPIYGISANRDAWWDLEPGRAIGYVPRDDAAELEPPEPGPDDAMEGARVGGPYASAALDRRPFEGERP